MHELLRKILNILDGTSAVYGRRDRGQSVVEMAFITPILIILILGLVEVGWFTNNYLILLEVSRVASRFGTVQEGDNAPLAWELNPEARDGVLAPVLNDPPLYKPPFENIEDSIYDEDLGEPPVVYRDCGVRADGTGIGFYELLACLALNSMDPLELREDPSPTEGTPDSNDDIVISVFSSNLIPSNYDYSGYTAEEQAILLKTTAEERDLISNELRNQLPFEDTANAEIFDEDLDDEIYVRGADPATHTTAQVMITGRYPTNANECDLYTERDPFDTNNNGLMDRFEIDRNRWDFIETYNPTETRQTLSDDMILNDAGLDPAALVLPLDPDNDDEFQVGFAYTGKHEIDGSADLTGGPCYGSEWSIRDMEAMLNLRGLQDFEREAGVNADSLERNFLPPSQSMVLVEIFWTHDLLIDIGFSPVLNALGGEGTADIYVWAAFPVPSAEFNMELEPNDNS